MSQKGQRKQRNQQINVQEYRTQGFKQPQDLQEQDQSQSSIVQQFQHIPTANSNSVPATKPVPKPLSSQKRSSLQQSQHQNQSTRNQLILQFKISQLQKICSTLTSANEKLLDKIEELQDENDRFKGRIGVLEAARAKVESQYEESREDLVESREGTVEAEQKDNNGSEAEQNDEDQMQLEQEVVDIQKMIKEYREELTKAQQINKTIKQSYQQTISNLQQQLSSIKQTNIQLQQLNKQLQQQLLEIQTKNTELQNQSESLKQYIEEFQSRQRTSSRSSQYQTPIQDNRNPGQYARRYEDQLAQVSPFDSSVQVQLERLIQKLVKELQYERQMKKKITEEMKRIQKQLLQSEKEIMVKNKKIYQLEMNLIQGQKINSYQGQERSFLAGSNLTINKPNQQRSNKYSSFLNTSQEQQYQQNNPQLSPKIKQKYLTSQPNPNLSPSSNRQSIKQTLPTSKPLEYYPTKPQSQSPSSSGKLLQTFSLLQLLNQPTITLSINQKLHICLKLVAFYEQKIYQHKNYNLLMLQNVLVTNFNRINLKLIKIRVEESTRNQQSTRNSKTSPSMYTQANVADGPQKVIWNLAFLLNSLLVDVPTKQPDFGNTTTQKGFLDFIQNLLDNRNLNKQAFPILINYIEQDLSQRSTQKERSWQ